MNWQALLRKAASTVFAGMSETAGESKRGGRKGGDSQAASQRQSAGARDGNAAPQQNRKGGGGKGQQQTKQSDTVTNGPAPLNRPESRRAESTQSVPAEEHIPVNGFNAQEVREGLRLGPESKPAVYNPTEKPAPARSGSPWASKPNVMASGKDFFLELRKQVTTLQQTGGASLGG